MSLQDTYKPKIVTFYLNGIVHQRDVLSVVVVEQDVACWLRMTPNKSADDRVSLARWLGWRPRTTFNIIVDILPLPLFF